jgi:hypothetical protein
MKTDLTCLIWGLMSSVLSVLSLVLAFFTVDWSLFGLVTPFILIAVALFALILAVRGGNH